MPAFRGGDGKFDRATFDLVLRNNGLNEGRFLGMMKADVAQRQLFDPVRAGGTVPDVMLRELFAFQQEKRIAEYRQKFGGDPGAELLHICASDPRRVC